MEEGYDSIVYRNLFESPKDTRVCWSWIALDPDIVVPLPRTAGDTLANPVGNPVLLLPSQVRDIPACRYYSGGLRYVADRLAGISAVRAVVEESGGVFGSPKYRGDRDHQNTYDFAIPLGGGEIVGSYKAGFGRASLEIPEVCRENIPAFVDDFMPYVGLNAPGSRNGVFLEWQIGEEAGTFAERLKDFLRMVVEAVPEFSMVP